MLKGNYNNLTITLIDGMKTNSFCGTAEYIAPEIIIGNNIYLEGSRPPYYI